MGKRISQLDAAGPITGAEVIPVVQGGVTKKATADQIRTYSDTSCQCTLISRYSSIGIGTDADLIEKYFQTWQMPADTLATDGSWLEIIAWGETGATNNTKSLKIYLGETVIYEKSTAPANNKKWELCCKLRRNSQTAQSATTENMVFDSGTGYQIESTEDLGTVLQIAISGQNGTAAANDILWKGLIIRLNSMDTNS